MKNLNGHCKELTEKLEKAAAEKEELADQYSELVKMKENMEATFNSQVTEAIESGENLLRQGMYCELPDFFNYSRKLKI